MSVSPTALDVICPMHVVLDPVGRIVHAGPTLQKLTPSHSLIGQDFLDVFEVTRPQGVTRSCELVTLSGSTLHLKHRTPPFTGFKAVLAMRPDGKAGAVVNMSFGLSVVDAVRSYALSNADFAPTDLTVEMLYLVEAKSAVMAASRRLNERLQEAKTLAEQQAVTDTLTGLENRRGFEQFLTRLIARQARFALLQVDLDGFKRINDTFGHDVGDQILQEAARIMTEEVRDRDLAARIGGDEFILLIDGDPSPETLTVIATRLIRRMQALELPQSDGPPFGCSIGAVRSSDLAPLNAQDMLKAADLALYRSKRAGRGRLTVHDPTRNGWSQHQVLDDTEVMSKPAG